METASELVESIIADARSQALTYDDETRDIINRMRSETDQLVAKERERMYAQVRQREESLRAQAEAKRSLETTNTILQKKQELIDATFASANDAIHHMSLPKRKKLLTTLWNRANKQLRITTVKTTKHDAPFFKGKCMVMVTPGTEGFYASSGDNKISIDCRFTTLLEQVKTQKTKEIADMLFKEQKKRTTKRATTKKPRRTTKRRKL